MEAATASEAKRLWPIIGALLVVLFRISSDRETRNALFAAAARWPRGDYHD